MKLLARPVLLLGGGVGLAAYVAVDSVLGDLADTLRKGILGIPGQFVDLWSKSFVGDCLFVVGTVTAVVVGLITKGKPAVAYAALITWITYAAAATATYPVPTFGEGSTGPTGPENLGWMLVGTPIVGIFGLGFTVTVLLLARKRFRGGALASLKLVWSGRAEDPTMRET